MPDFNLSRGMRSLCIGLFMWITLQRLYQNWKPKRPNKEYNGQDHPDRSPRLIQLDKAVRPTQAGYPSRPFRGENLGTTIQ